jgi:hypothetical protein
VPVQVVREARRCDSRVPGRGASGALARPESTAVRSTRRAGRGVRAFAGRGSRRHAGGPAPRARVRADRRRRAAIDQRPRHRAPGAPCPEHAVHQLDPDMLAAVLVGPSVMLEGYEPEKLLPAIACPVLLVQADPRFGNALSDHDVALGLPSVAQRDARAGRWTGPPAARHPTGADGRAVPGILDRLQARRG